MATQWFVPRTGTLDRLCWPRRGAGVAASDPRAQAPIEDLRKVLDEQRALIDRQATRLEAQEAELAALRKRVDEVSTLALGASNAVAELKQQPTAPTADAAIEQRLQAIEQSVQRAPGDAPRSRLGG